MQPMLPLTPEPERPGCGCGVVLIVVLLFVALGGISPLVVAVPFPLNALIAGAFVVLLLLVILLQVRRTTARRKFAQLTRPSAAISVHPLRVGEQFLIDCSFPPTAHAIMQGGTISLVLREVARYESGTGSDRTTTTLTHDHVIATHNLPALSTYGQPAIPLRWSFLIPLTAMHSFKAANNELRWYIEVAAQIQVRKQPRARKTSFLLTVLPEKR